MATEATPEVPGIVDDDVAGGDEPSKGGGFVKIAVFVVVLMGIEAVVLMFVLPSAPAEQSTETEVAEAETIENETVEVSVGKFAPTNSRAAPGTVIHLQFTLVALVSPDNEVRFDEAVNKRYKHQVREKVIKVARSSSLDDLSDPNLSTIKRLVKEEINKLLRKSYISEIVISDFKRTEI